MLSPIHFAFFFVVVLGFWGMRQTKKKFGNKSKCFNHISFSIFISLNKMRMVYTRSVAWRTSTKRWVWFYAPMYLAIEITSTDRDSGTHLSVLVYMKVLPCFWWSTSLFILSICLSRNQNYLFFNMYMIRQVILPTYLVNFYK